jgi:hypothetical protein
MIAAQLSKSRDSGRCLWCDLTLDVAGLEVDRWWLTVWSGWMRRLGCFGR